MRINRHDIPNTHSLYALHAEIA